MDFIPPRSRSCPANIPLPFYMTYPNYLGWEQENGSIKDLEYLQQMYPTQTRKYQRKVAEILDKLDYEGSMIYDEYPDKFGIMRLAKTVVEMLKHEEEALPQTTVSSQEKWDWLENVVQILLCDEIYKRRHGGKRGIIQF